MSLEPLPELPADVLAGVVIRPPALTWDGVRYAGPRLRRVDEGSVAGLPGLVRLLVRENFVGLVALNAAFANEAAARLELEWEGASPAARNHVWPEASAQEGGLTLARDYRWPLPVPDLAWATAWQARGQLWVAAASEAPQRLRAELARLLDLPPSRIRLCGNGQPASAAARDLAADAALLACTVGHAVRVTSEGLQCGPTSLAVHLQATQDAEGRLSNGRMQLDDDGAWPRPAWAQLLLGGQGSDGMTPDIGMVSPYVYPRWQVEAPLPAGPEHVAPLRLQRAAGLVFAQECFADEAAAQAAVDPIEFRLRQLDDARGAALIRSVWADAQTQGLSGPAGEHGRGFAYACVLDAQCDPPRRSWSAWVADVSVDRRSGELAITRVVVGHDSEHLQASPADQPAIEQQVQDTARLLLQRPAAFDDAGGRVTGTSMLQALPQVQLVRSGGELAVGSPLAWSEAAALPAAAAVANAIFNATGVRLREPPFSGLAARQALIDVPPPARKLTAWWAGLGVAAVGLVALASPWRAAIPPVVPDLSIYSPAALERGRLVAAAGDCVVCHTAPGGTPNAGGFALDTPFGTIYTTNITPDVQTGIGAWSYPAFERAMRDGIHRDGRRLYPAFPYTAFAKISEGDMTALYAYLMSQPAVSATPPPTQLAFPFNLRSALGGWNLLFHDTAPYQADPTQSLAWNRGAYLVQGAGHCGACHTPRNALGAEKGGRYFLAGGEAEGWEAPALNQLSRAPLAWTQTDLYQYLRSGYSPRHGGAAGPMAPVIRKLGELPDSDIQAMATYLASPGSTEPKAQSISAVERAQTDRFPALPAAGERLFRGACAVCHEAASGPTLFGVKTSLGLSSSLHSTRPDNLILAILQGVPLPAHRDLGTMPAFADSLDDRQVAELATYLRARYASDQPAWRELPATVARLRAKH